MKFQNKTFFPLIIIIVLIIGCAKRVLVPYNQVERTNSIVVSQMSGKKIEGTVLKKEPHQLIILEKDRSQIVIAKSSISTIKRKPPVYDDFGRGISEEEIKLKKTNTNALIYGIGGGALSFGASFFVGSLVGKELGATTGAGGVFGTILFISGGKAKDRQVAIDRIREKRRSEELVRKSDEKKTPSELDQVLQNEKLKQEELRKEREKILRELDDKKKK
jgi:hypothetical protein